MVHCVQCMLWKILLRKICDHNEVVCSCDIIKLRAVLIRILRNYSQISDINVEHYILSKQRRTKRLK